MRSKLNPDGARIRALRIQRGWTQEQLAEIAGISSRTVQRAETAYCASFDTVRAIAGAFETDFDQLLKPEAVCASDREPQAVNLPHMPSSGPEIETISVDSPKPQLRRAWVMPVLSISTLVLGLATGAILTTHLNMGEKVHSLEPSSITTISRPTKTLEEPMPLVTAARQEKSEQSRLSQLEKTAVPNHQVIVAKSRSESIPTERPPGMLITEDPSSRDIIQNSQGSASHDSPMSSYTLLSELVIPELPIAFNEAPVLSGDRSLDEPNPGAVRQAVDLAAKKTGAAFSKVGISLKRVF